jgi:hypothetical protein
MTAQQPQREYIITESEVQIIEWKGGNTLAATIRSRPHTPAPSCVECPNPSLRNEQFRSKLENQRKMYEERLEQASRAATLAENKRVLDVINSGKSALYEIMPDGHWDAILQAKMDVLCWIEESLRTAAQEQSK